MALSFFDGWFSLVVGAEVALRRLVTPPEQSPTTVPGRRRRVPEVG